MPLVDGHPGYDVVSKFHEILNRAKDALKTDKMHVLWEDFMDSPTGYTSNTRWNATAGNNTFSFIGGDEAGGSLILSTGATANTFINLNPANAFAGNPTSKGFYLHCRAKIPTTPDAQSVLHIGVGRADGTSIGVGVYGANSATQFAAQHSAILATNFVNLGQTVDTAYHDFQLWAPPGGSSTLWAKIDEKTPISFTLSAAYTLLRIFITARNNGTAADQRLQLAHLLVAAQP